MTGAVGMHSLHMLTGGVVLGLLRDMVVVGLSLGEVLSMGVVGLGVEYVAKVDLMLGRAVGMGMKVGMVGKAILMVVCRGGMLSPTSRRRCARTRIPGAPPAPW